MYLGDLPSGRGSQQTEDAMPLPQFIYRSAFFSALIAAVLLGVSVPGAYAGHSSLTSNPRSLWFNKVVSGQSETLSVTVTNSGSSSVTVSSVSVNNAAFTINNLSAPLTLAAGQSVEFSVTFAPTTVGSVSGDVTFNSNSGTFNLPLNGKGVANWDLTASPASLDFGNVSVGTSSTLPLTINNPGTTSQTVSIGRVGGAGFSVSGVKLPLVLDAGQSFTFSVIFTPASAGAASGSILASSPTDPVLTVPLTGTGVNPSGQLNVSPSTMNFGNLGIGQNAAQNGQLTATGSSVTVSSASMSNGVFQLSGISLPMSIAAGQSVNYTVTFTPQTSGVASGTLSFASNATNSPAVESLTGTGNSYSVNLTWDPSSQAVGYNVYRSSQSGGPYSRLNSGLDPNTAYTDGSVVGGQTYYYATTAVNAQGQESSYSNLAQVAIP
jgi:Abnormal spindle-like microcephaly-assoc'd, ASPM-SPD-2-Hydin